MSCILDYVAVMLFGCKLCKNHPLAWQAIVGGGAVVHDVDVNTTESPWDRSDS